MTKNTAEDARYYAIKFMLDDMIEFIDYDNKTIKFYADGNAYLESKGFNDKDLERYKAEKFKEIEASQ